MKKLIGLLLIMNTSFSGAAEWSCRNQDMEIYCDTGKCTVSDGFTPMSVHFDDKGRMSICAYSGCWEGVGKVISSGNYTVVTGHDLKFSTSKESGGANESFLIAFDSDDNVSIIKGHGYAMPMNCIASGNE